MSVFSERDINKEKFQGTFFKEVQIELVKSKRVNPEKDWFNHEKYMKETMPRLNKIKPPFQLIKCNEDKKKQLLRENNGTKEDQPIDVDQETSQ